MVKVSSFVHPSGLSSFREMLPPIAGCAMDKVYLFLLTETESRLTLYEGMVNE